MHAKGRIRGKNLRYIKNPNKTFFKYAEPHSEIRAIKGQHVLTKNKLNRKPQIPDHSSHNNDSEANKK